MSKSITCDFDDCTNIAVVGSPDGNYCWDHQGEAGKDNVETNA